MGFYKTTLSKDTYSELYKEKIVEYCKEHGVLPSDIIVQSFVIWMCVNGYITIDDNRTSNNNLMKIFKIARWILEYIEDVKNKRITTSYKYYSDEQLLKDNPVFNSYMCPSGRIMILPYNPCIKGKKDVISRRFDLNKKTLKGLCDVCGFAYKQKGSKFKAEACFYDIKKKI